MSLTVSVDVGDGSLVSYDRARRQLILTMKNGSVLSAGMTLPARPNPPVTTTTTGMLTGLDLDVERPPPAPLAPVTKTATAMKLGWKKFAGIESWKKRILKLDESSISYHEAEDQPPKNVIKLNAGVEVRVVQAREPARKDRFEDRETGMFQLMSANIGMLASPFGSPIGKPNCVECHVPTQVGNMLNTVMSNNAFGLAFGGGREGLQKSKARTFYFSFNTEQEAHAFADAIKNNVDILIKGASLGAQSTTSRHPDLNSHIAGNFAGLDNALNQGRALMQNAKLMQDPNTSLEWYKVTLNTDVPDDVLYEKLISFYDQLAAVNVQPSY